MTEITRDQLDRLKRYTSFDRLHGDEVFKKFFVRHYMTKPLSYVAYDLFDLDLTYQQIDILDSVDYDGGRLAVPSGHGIGKTHIIGTLATTILLLFYKSIVRVQAPTMPQITNFTFKEIGNRIVQLKRHKKWGFLANFFELLTKKVFIKGHGTSWYVEAKTAPKANPVNLAGQHNRFYCLILEECTGIDDEHIKVSLGALTEKFNFCIAFSQWTTRNHIFNEMCTTNSKMAGGVWDVKPQNSMHSPLVGDEAMNIYRQTYTQSELRVKCYGQPPIDEDGVLFNYELIEDFLHNIDVQEDIYYSTLIVSTDVAYTGVRDSGVTTVLLAGKRNPKSPTYYQVIELNVFDGYEKKGLKPVEHVKKAIYIMLGWVRKFIDKGIPIKAVKYIIDATSGGREAYTEARKEIAQLSLRVDVYGIIWGSKKLFGLDKSRFVSNKAKGFFGLQKSLEEGRYSLLVDNHKDRTKRELSSTRYSTTKEEMKYRIEEHADSPDIVDTYVQVELVKVDYFEEDGVQNLVDYGEIVESMVVEDNSEVDESLVSMLGGD